MKRAAWRYLLLLGVVVIVAAPAHAATGGPVTGPLSRSGRWLTDRKGRVAVLHGVNIVKKVAPFVRTQFTEADARLLADEGFTVARIGFIWEAVEPTPGHYDDAYVKKVLALDSLLGRYGIRTLVDFHQDEWSRQTGGDGAPAWATLGATADDSFAAFWRDAKGPDGVGIQTHFVTAWRHVAQRLKSHGNILGLDPFNEPYPGTDYPPPCGDFSPCAGFESGALAAFYRRVIGAIRAGGARQVIFPEGIADSGVATPALPRFADPQTAYTFHFYCNATQLDPREAPLDEPSPEAAACEPVEERDIGVFHDYARGLGVPALLGEFSCNDVNRDNAQVVDIAGRAFTSWTIWAYYTAADDPADCPRQGLLVDDTKPGSQANAKQLKLDALAVPYAQAIAGAPGATGFDRSTHAFTLSYEADGRGPTQVFIPARQYPKGYAVSASGASVASVPGAPWLLLRASRGAAVKLTVTPAAGKPTQRPLETGVLPLRPTCAGRRFVVLRAPRGGRIVSAAVNGRRRRVGRHQRSIRVSFHGRSKVRVRLVMRTRTGRRILRVSTLRRCAQ